MYPFFLPPAPEQCFSDEPIESCKTCCCSSDPKATFYNDRVPEPCCRAKSVASYAVRFIATWSDDCHPDYYREDAKWSKFLAASHNGGVSLWDSCFKDVSPGLETLAETGNPDPLEEEVAALIDGGEAYDSVIGAAISDGRLTGCERVHSQATGACSLLQ